VVRTCGLDVVQRWTGCRQKRCGSGGGGLRVGALDEEKQVAVASREQLSAAVASELREKCGEVVGVWSAQCGECLGSQRYHGAAESSCCALVHGTAQLRDQLQCTAQRFQLCPVRQPRGGVLCRRQIVRVPRDHATLRPERAGHRGQVYLRPCGRVVERVQLFLRVQRVEVF
jgi:hypothetical protein